MRVDKEYYLRILTDISLITEIVTESPMSDETRKIFLRLINSVESNTEDSAEDYEILKDRVAGWLVENQTETY